MGEELLDAGFVWVAAPRRRVPLLLLARHPHLLALTDRRLVLWRRPPRGRSLQDDHLALDAPLAWVTLDELRAWPPMLQLRVHDREGRPLVLEFRPRDRALGRRVAERLRGEAGDGPASGTDAVAGPADPARS